MHAGGVAAGTWEPAEGGEGGQARQERRQRWQRSAAVVEAAEEQCPSAAVWLEADECGGWAGAGSGEEAGGAALEAAAPLARPRGGANGWGGNRASSWSRWQKVLLVLLVWLVVPAEAAGAAQAAGGVAAAAAAAAAATSTILNYWAVMEDDTAGDLEVMNKGSGVIRIMSTNLTEGEEGWDWPGHVEGGLEGDDESSGGCCSGYLGSTGHRSGGWWRTRAGSTVGCWETEG